MANNKAKRTESYSKQKPEYCEILGRLMTDHGESQEKLAAAIGATRDRVNNWLLDRSKLDVESLIKIADHYGVTTDYVLGKSRSSKDLPTLRAAVEVTGLSEEAIVKIANGTGSVYRYCDDWQDKDKPDFYKTFDYLSPLDEDKVIILDELICRGDGEFFSALFKVKLLASNVEDIWEELTDWEAGKTDNPPLSGLEAFRLFQDLRHAMFDLTEEAKDIANELYNYDNALKHVRELMKVWSSIDFENALQEEERED